MKITKISALFMFALLALVSCKKDEDSVKDKLTKDTWKLIDSRSDNNADGELTADESDIDDCEKDDINTFHTDGTYHREEGATKCDPADPDSEEWPWTLASDNKTLTITYDGVPIPFEITEITGSTLVLRTSFLGLSEATFGR